ncbi:MAG: TrkH family potassium uptake protein [Candidatus Nitrohelix vancouverensis]|uniref:TrkH family potassium uptake protein n=1 Tax=Candidatus Nitrohelix vancouverensis TaxID=2705534 RepID=A0A7T0C1N3_9BACT|nr:MAG: TrkH family potassium uptake protein [Candidatus Nitrohelix vancouverensis]
MNIRAICNVAGILLALLSALMLLPMGVSLYFDNPPIEGYLTESSAFIITALCSLVLGVVMWKFFPSGVEQLRDREGFSIVAISWLFIALIGALPFTLTGVCPEFIDALFESMSGFTTTGASVLREIDTLPEGILFWRNLMQWLGGMGIIMLSLAIFPALGIGSFHLFKAEIPGGATVERMEPRLAETAKILWKTYLVLTLLEIFLLRAFGLSYFDAVCHTFSTVATGGFSLYSKSIGHYDNAYIEGIIFIFMFLGGINFALHFQLIRGNVREVFNNPEFRFYCSMLAIAILLASWGLIRANPDVEVTRSIRSAAFTVMSINTTTGFATDDFNLWPDYLKVILLCLMLVGGCSGSTSGSLKAIRFIVLLKIIARELKKLIHPRAIMHVKVAGKTLDPDKLTNTVALTSLFMGFAILNCIFLSMLGVDMQTSVSASVACLFNIGPGLGQVGPMGNYADIPALGKSVLIGYMLMGRLEIYGIILLFLPQAWRK